MSTSLKIWVTVVIGVSFAGEAWAAVLVLLDRLDTKREQAEARKPTARYVPPGMTKSERRAEDRRWLSRERGRHRELSRLERVHQRQTQAFLALIAAAIAGGVAGLIAIWAT